MLGIETGEGPVHMAASITALANDPRFDFSHAYWILAGIAGIDPNAGPVGLGGVGGTTWSTATSPTRSTRARYRAIGARATCRWAGVRRTRSRCRPRVSINGVNLFHLDAGFVNWAYEFSHAHVTLPDTSNLQTVRSFYTTYPATQFPPQVLKGDVLAAGTFWIGALLNTWAENWVNYWSHGKAVFTTTSEEDAGYAQALTFLSQINKIDFKRVLVLRSASDFSVPHPGQTAAELLANDASGTGYSAFIESLQNVYLTGSSVVNEIVDHWDVYCGQVPSN